MTRTLIHPSMLARLKPHHLSDTGTVQVTTETRDAVGGVTDSWADLTDHVDISCAIAVMSGDERRSPEMTFADGTHTALLSGSFTSITTKHRFVTGGNNYDILAVEHDSQGISTRLRLRLVVR